MKPKDDSWRQLQLLAPPGPDEVSKSIQAEKARKAKEKAWRIQQRKLKQAKLRTKQ